MKSQRVLVIDDSRDAVTALGRVLQIAGYQVVAAYDGDEGVAKAYEYLPEVVLCDIRLPGSVDGYMVAQRLREYPPLEAALLIAVTGMGLPDDARRARDAGYDLHFTKPVDALALEKVIADRFAVRSSN